MWNFAPIFSIKSPKTLGMTAFGDKMWSDCPKTRHLVHHLASFLSHRSKIEVEKTHNGGSVMGYIQGDDRRQQFLLPPSIDEYVDE
ncbi:MAG: hypothetical protein WAP12_03905, partial [Saccharofermentanales bacterium]